MIFLIYTILVILQLYTGIATVVQDPCPEAPKNSNIVADMCKSSSAREETSSGGPRVDSVVLRIMTQQDDCICRVTLDNQKNPVVVGLSKVDGLTESAPEKADCGLEVDINHIPDMSNGIVIDPIECIVNSTIRHTPLFQKSYLQFRSKIINGEFIRGFCIRIIRDIKSDHSQVLRIQCDTPMATQQKIEQTTEYDLMTETSSYSTNSPITSITYPQTTDSLQLTTKRTKEDTIENDKTTYIALGAFSSTVAIILLIALVITCIRYKTILNERRTNENVNNSNHQVEYNRHYCDLTNNGPNVPGQDYDIIDSNYNTIDVDRSHPSNNVVCMEGDYINVEPDGHLTTNIN